MATNRARFSVTLTDDLYDSIDRYQHYYRIKTRTEAISQLLEKGFKAKPIPSEDSDTITPIDKKSWIDSMLKDKELVHYVEILFRMRKNKRKEIYSYIDFVNNKE